MKEKDKIPSTFEDLNRKIYKDKSINHINMLPGDLKRSPDESFFKNSIVFIDGNFLSKLSNHFGEGKYLIYDLIIFSKNLTIKQKLSCQNIFYYTAPPFQSAFPSKEEENKKFGYDRFINKLREKGVIVREGRCQRLKIDGKFEYRQKAVDILLAMDLMSVPLKYKEVKRIILIASDSDFVPVIKSLKDQGISTILYTYYEKKRNTNFSRSNHLIKSVYKYVLLSKKDFDNSKLIKNQEKKHE